MDRFNDLLAEVAKAAGEKYAGKKRSELKDNDFLFPETRSFPIVTPQDVPDAISNFGRMKGKMSYPDFLRKLYNMAKRKGQEFVAALPEASKQQLGLKKKITKSYIGNLDDDLMTPTETNYFELDRVNLASLRSGDMVKNINQSCKHYGSEGYVDDVSELPDFMGHVVRYIASNSGATWSKGDKLTKTPDQLIVIRKPKTQSNNDQLDEDDNLTEYKDEFLGMSISSIKAILAHANHILSGLMDTEKKDFIKENLTESWLQGKIAVTEENMRTIHDFVMFSEPETDIESEANTSQPFRKDPQPDVMDPQNKDIEDNNIEYMDDFSGVWANKPGLWENIRKKKEREGKSYQPAKPGDKNRPSPEQWKRLTDKKENI